MKKPKPMPKDTTYAGMRKVGRELMAQNMKNMPKSKGKGGK